MSSLLRLELRACNRKDGFVWATVNAALMTIDLKPLSGTLTTHKTDWLTYVSPSNKSIRHVQNIKTICQWLKMIEGGSFFVSGEVLLPLRSLSDTAQTPRTHHTRTSLCRRTWSGCSNQSATAGKKELGEGERRGDTPQNLIIDLCANNIDSWGILSWCTVMICDIKQKCS